MWSIKLSRIHIRERYPITWGCIVRTNSPYTPPTAVFDIFKREFDGAKEESGLFVLTMHPHVIGYRSRIWILDNLIDHMKASGDVWFATHADIARYIKDTSGLAG